MERFDRIPAFPLIANDPYFSVWLPADTPTGANTVHWSGARKWMRAHMRVDGVTYRVLGKNGVREAKTTCVRVTPTRTLFTLEAGGVRLKMTFTSPMLPDDLDMVSTPVTIVDFAAVSLDGREHEMALKLDVPVSLCYDGESQPEMMWDFLKDGGMNVCCIGQSNQKLLSHSGDRITIDWGYLYTASSMELSYDGGVSAACCWNETIAQEEKTAFVLLGYEDVASVNYFGVPCRAWYARNGRTIMDALADFYARHDEILAACASLDERVMQEAREVGGEDYELIVSASWRHTFAAHKLIATPQGEMALLSKENDSNGCIGTVDLSYPSAPIFLKYCPELVNAMCRPVLYFASLPVWGRPYSPHDVGRYPHATGQVYARRRYLPGGKVYMPCYLYPAGSDVYNDHNQMPVEESGNMLTMMAAAVRFGARDDLARAYMDTLETWAKYLSELGEDPGEQLCTDDFAGHLAHNVNLSAKAMVGVACYAELLRHFGRADEADAWAARAKEMAASWTARTQGEATPLTFAGEGWSMKYNLVWDLTLGLGLMDEAFYLRETQSYLPRQNAYGLPLDSRADYSKADWICWAAAMAKGETRRALLAPLAHYLRHTKTRVPFSDWYDTVTGDYVEFIARSVLGGVFMPMLVREA